MRNVHKAVFFASAYLALDVKALPRPQASPTYSVVNVGGPSGYSVPAPDTLVETVTISPTLETVTEAPVTVTVTDSSAPTVTEEATVTIEVTETSAPYYTPPPAPVYTPSPVTWWPVVTKTNTATFYEPGPMPYYPSSLSTSTSSTTSSSSSTSCKGPYPTTWGRWNSTMSTAVWPTGTGTGTVFPYHTGSIVHGYKNFY